MSRVTLRWIKRQAPPPPPPPPWTRRTALRVLVGGGGILNRRDEQVEGNSSDVFEARTNLRSSVPFVFVGAGKERLIQIT